MKLNRTEPNQLFTLILAFHITSVHVEASHDDDADVRILIVGMRGDSRFSAADILSGRKAGGQEDREIGKTPVMTDEGRRMMLVTGPNLCEDDTATQSFTTALCLSSPGPHAVLMLLNLEDEDSEECDVVKRVQERLGADVLQYCIVLLHQNHQERLTGASRAIAGEMINACGGRFHMIRDSDPKPAQTAALLAEIHKLVWLNDHRFYSGLNETQRLESEKLELLKRLKEIGVKLEENHVVSAVPDALGVVGCSLIISLIVFVLATEKNVKMLIFQATLAGLVTFMASIRNALGPHVAFALNLALCSTVATIFIKYLPMRKLDNIEKKTRRELSYTVSLGVTLGSVASVRTLSDVFIACFASIGVAFGTFAFLKLSFELKTMNVRELFLLFLFCAVGAELTMLCVIVIAAVFGNIIVILIIIIIVIAYYTSNMQKIEFLPRLVVFPCCCVLIGSVVLTLDMLLYFLQGCIEYLLGSFLFYPALLLGTLMMMAHLSPLIK